MAISDPSPRERRRSRPPLPPLGRPLFLGLLLAAAAAPALFPVPAAAASPPPAAAEGLSLYLHAAGNPRGADVIAVPAGAPLTAALGVASGERKPLPLRLICLLDLRQVPFRLDGRTGTSFDLLIPPGAAWTAHQVEVPPAGEGTHDLVLGLFLLPDLHREDPDFRRDTPFFFEALRHAVVWGRGGGPPRPGIEPGGEGDPQAAGGLSSFSLSPADDGRELWPGEAAPGAPYFIRFSNAGDEERDFALVALLDFSQVPLAAGEPVARRRLRPGSKTSIEGRLPGAGDAGLHEFLVLLVEEPSFDPAREAPPDVHSSRRLLLRVR